MVLEHREKTLFGGRTNKKLRLDAGLLSFVIKQDDKTLTFEIDLIKLKMMIESLEKSHGLQPNEDDEFIATNEFIGALIESLSSLGCPVVSETIARQIWVTTAEAFASEEAKFKRRLAHFLR